MSKQSKQIIKEKYREVNRPNTDLDYIEVPLLYDGSYEYKTPPEQSTEDRAKDAKRKTRLIRKIFKAAAASLTDRQFQIFILRTLFGLKETDIASQIKVNQSYIAIVLKASHVKIRKALRLKPKHDLPISLPL